jgi:hypothetical protein
VAYVDTLDYSSIAGQPVPSASARGQLRDILHVSDLAAPSLPGAKCRNRVELFDRAAGGCAQCPSLQLCPEWYDSLKPHQRPRGVVAGQVVTKRSAHTP